METTNPQIIYPRITIQFCTQCKWLLRAAYYAQELLSTFSSTIGEVALQPAVGGAFVVTLYTSPPTLAPPSPSPTPTPINTIPTPSSAAAAQPSSILVSTPTAENGHKSPEEEEKEREIKIQTHILWDRKSEGGFPETKILKQRVRNIIDPGRKLGHVDGKNKESRLEGSREIKVEDVGGEEVKGKDAAGGKGEGEKEERKKGEEVCEDCT